MYVVERLIREPEAFQASLLADIPRDPGALLVYLLLTISLFLVWRGSRQRSR